MTGSGGNQTYPVFSAEQEARIRELFGEELAARDGVLPTSSDRPAGGAGLTGRYSLAGLRSALREWWAGAPRG